MSGIFCPPALSVYHNGHYPPEYIRPAGFACSSSLTLVVTANLLYACPFHWRGGHINNIASRVTTALSGNLRHGLYAHDLVTDGPAHLLFGGGTVSTSTTGNKATAANQNFPPGLMWLVVAFSAAPTMRAFDFGVGVQRPNFGSASAVVTDIDVDLAVGFSVSFAFAALPSTFPAVARTYLGGASVFPLLHVQQT